MEELKKIWHELRTWQRVLAISLLLCLIASFVLAVEEEKKLEKQRKGNGLCFDPPKGTEGVSIGTSGLVDPTSGLPKNVHCSIFFEEGGKRVYFNASIIGGDGCVYSEVVQPDLMNGGVIVTARSGGATYSALDPCLEWASKYIWPKNEYTQHWAKMLEEY